MNSFYKRIALWSTAAAMPAALLLADNTSALKKYVFPGSARELTTIGASSAKGIHPVEEGRTSRTYSRIGADFPNSSSDRADNGIQRVPVREYKLIGSIYYADHIPGNGEALGTKGMYGIPTSPDEDFQLIKYDIAATGGGCEIGGIYYMVTYIPDSGTGARIILKKYDSQTWELLWKSEDDTTIEQAALDVAYDTTTGNVYGCFNNANNDGYTFGTIDYTGDWSRRVIAICDEYIGVAASPEGQIYAITNQGVLLKVNKETGEETVVGDTGLRPEYQSSATWNPTTGHILFSYSTNDPDKVVEGWQQNIYGGLYDVDPVTAKATLVLRYPRNQNVLGMCVPGPKGKAGAPGTAQNLRFDFDNDPLKGDVAFTIPALTYDGKPLSGKISYHVTDNLEEAGAGESEAGGEVRIRREYNGIGSHDFTVVLSNEAGNSPAASVTVQIGKDRASQPSWAKAVQESGNENVVAVTWAPVSTTENNGYIDPDKIFYLVKRYPDEVVVANGITTCEFTDTLPEANNKYRYYYGIWVNNGYSQWSKELETNSIIRGGASLPFSEDFSSISKSKQFTIIDANADLGNIWTYEISPKYMSYLSSMFVKSDDWLMTPPLCMEAGKVFRVSMMVREAYAGDGRNRISLMAGKGNTVADMTETIMPETIVTNSNDSVWSWLFTPESNGNYVLGLHATSDVAASRLIVDDILVEPGVRKGAPAEVPLFEIERDPNGEKAVTISFAAPTKDLEGKTISSLDKVEIWRDNDLVSTFSGVAAGQMFSVLNTADRAKRYTYRLIPYNAAGAGMPSSKSVFVGVNEPVQPLAATASEITPGEVRLEWTAPDVDIEGERIPADKIIYNIYMYGNGTPSITVAEGISGTSITHRAVETGSRDMVQYEVYAETEGGWSRRGVKSDLLFVGAPYSLPFAESVKDGNLGTLCGIRSYDGDTGWYICDDTRFSDVQSQDQDNGFLMMRGSYTNGQAEIFFGKIDLSGVGNPVLSFHTFNLSSQNGSDINLLKVQARAEGGEWVNLKSVTMNELDNFGWNKVDASLSQFEGKVIEFRFIGTIGHYSTMFIDNMSIESHKAKDIAISRLEIPDYVRPGEAYTVIATVSNLGLSHIDGAQWQAELLANGEKVDSLPGKGMDFEQLTALKFDRIAAPDSPETIEYVLRVISNGDEDLENNTLTKNMSVFHGHGVPVSDLTAMATDGGTRLSWSEPDQSLAAPAESIDDFEGYEPFEYKQPGEWTLIDADGSDIGGLKDIDFPNIPDAGEGPCGFFVFDSSYEALGNLVSLFTPYSGKNFMANMYTRSGQCDDWMISPRLFGGQQMISFMARAVSSSPERIQVLYSTTDTDPSDFTEIADYPNIGYTWTRFTVILPTGARYFALRGLSKDGFMVFIDDVCFTPEGAPMKGTIIGYNIYRNGVLINDNPLKTTEFTDTYASESDRWFVTALYADGESRASNIVELNPTSAITVSKSGEVGVAGESGAILVSGAEGRKVEVFAMSGISVASANVYAAEYRVSCAPGIYMVRIDGKPYKVMVK